MYLYGHAANEEYRSTVPQIRSGQYENLPEKVLESPLTLTDKCLSQILGNKCMCPLVPFRDTISLPLFRMSLMTHTVN